MRIIFNVWLENTQISLKNVQMPEIHIQYETNTKIKLSSKISSHSLHSAHMMKTAKVYTYCTASNQTAQHKMKTEEKKKTDDEEEEGAEEHIIIINFD